MNRIFSPFQQFLLTWLLVLLTGWLTLSALSYLGEPISILLTAALIAFFLNYAVAALLPFLPRSVAALLVYLLAGITVVLIGLTLVPPVFNQAAQFVANFPSVLESAQEQLAAFQTWSMNHNLPFDVRLLTSDLVARVQTVVQTLTSKGFGLVLGTFNWFFDLIFILVMAFYMLVDGERLWQGITSIFSPQIQYSLTETLAKNLQRFVSGQLFLGLFMTITLAPAFFFLGVPFFLLFAVFIGAMEVIPYVGASLGITTVTIVVAFINWWLALKVLAVAIGLQQIKDNIVAPRLMGNLTGLSPVVIFVSLLLGAKAGGLLGVILAIPLTGVIKTLAEILLEPTLPPQTGSFFHNPFDKGKLNPAPKTSEKSEE